MAAKTAHLAGRLESAFVFPYLNWMPGEENNCGESL